MFEESASLAGPGNLVFTGTDDDPDTLATLARLGFAEPARVAAMVRGWHHGRIRATRSQRAREILTEFVPELLRVFGATANPDTALLRFDHFLSRLPAGVQLFSLFHANPGLFSLVADIMAEAPLLADNLAQRPSLLEAVLTARIRRAAARPRRAGRGSRRRPCPARAISRTRSTCCAAGPASGAFRSASNCCGAGSTAPAPAPRSADIAEAALAALLPAVVADFARVHGVVPGGAFAVVAMGRLGSREMTLGSDLDLILIYDAPEADSGRTGRGRWRVPTYYARLSQRLISAITAPTGEGRLYEVDMRLRPSGESGPIASSLAAFAQYQRESAWTWEHHGADPGTADRRRPGIARARRRSDRGGADRTARPERLLADVADMRRRIAEAHAGPSPWDLRNRRGGLVDLEFTVQYLMLREAAHHPEVLRREPAAALAALGKAGALPPQGARELGEALGVIAPCAGSAGVVVRGRARPRDADGRCRRDAGALRRGD